MNHLKVPVGDVNTENAARTHRHHTRFGATGGDRIQRADGIRAHGATEVPDTAPSKEQQRIGALLAKLRVGVKGEQRIGPYTVDFAAPAVRLIVEVDGYKLRTRMNNIE